MQFVNYNGRLSVPGTNDDLAFIDYEEDRNTWKITNTYVSPALRGQGIAQQMIDELVSLARKQNIKINPACPFAKQVFEKGLYADIELK